MNFEGLLLVRLQYVGATGEYRSLLFVVTKMCQRTDGFKLSSFVFRHPSYPPLSSSGTIFFYILSSRTVSEQPLMLSVVRWDTGFVKCKEGVRLVRLRMELYGFIIRYYHNGVVVLLQDPLTIVVLLTDPLWSEADGWGFLCLCFCFRSGCYPVDRFYLLSGTSQVLGSILTRPCVNLFCGSYWYVFRSGLLPYGLSGLWRFYFLRPPLTIVGPPSQ